MDSDHTIIRHGAVAVKDGEIVATGKASALEQAFLPQAKINGKDRIVMPGLINGHTHAAMTLLRGLADDLPLMEWLNGFIFPAEVKFVDADFVRIGTQLACSEMLKGGTTTIVDMYYFPDTVASVLSDCGMRGIVASTVIGQPSPDAENPEQGLLNTTAFIRRWQERDSRITPALGPHAIYTTRPETLLKVRDVALALDVPISMHISESESEVQYAREMYGSSTINLLDEIGFLDRGLDLIGAHVVWPDQNEIQLLHRHQVGAIHNPTSNMKVTAGVAPVGALLAAGVSVGLGTDGAASNNDLDMWEEMRLAALLQKSHNQDPTALPAEQVLRMATQGGANAIGLGDEVGSLSVGKRADIIQVSIASAHMQPLYNVTSHLVYVAKSEDVKTVIIDGQLVVADGEVLTIAEDELGLEVREISSRIAKALLPGVN